MRTFWIIAGIMLIGVAVAPRGSAGESPTRPALKLGMLQAMFRDVQPAMVQAMARPFRTLFERQTGLTGDVEIIPDAETLANKMKDKELQLGVFHGFEYAQIRARYPEIRPMLVSVPHGRTCQACVIVHKDCKAETIADLTGESLVIPRGIKAHCLAFLEKARCDLPADTAIPTVQPNLSTESVLNGVANGTNPAALVDVGAFGTYQNLQPGAAKRLRVLCKSEVFPVSVITYRKGMIDESVLNRIRSGLVSASSSPSGKPLLMLWNLSGFEELPADYEAQLDNILKAYPPPQDRNTTGPSK